VQRVVFPTTFLSAAAEELLWAYLWHRYTGYRKKLPKKATEKGYRKRLPKKAVLYQGIALAMP
jgi:hypothetical protein